MNSSVECRPAHVPVGAQRGQVIVWTAVMLPLFLSVIGLALDGGLVFAARREAQNAADAAARAGAMQIDERAYRESGGTRVVLELGRARATAAEYLAGYGTSLTASVAAEPLERQRQFFEKHMAPWIGRFFADLEGARAAEFYRHVGTVGRLFVEIENQAFALSE